MINTDSDTVIKYCKSISTPINKGNKIPSIQFHVLTATWVGSGCLPRFYCPWSDAPLRFVSQCHLIGTKTFMLMIIDENYIEFLISI